MPNGGIDNCGTCCFNRVNDGAVGQYNEGDAYCEIRDVAIAAPLHTYCANHPDHNPDRIETPVGPIVHGNQREEMVSSPDTPQVRDRLLELLDEMSEIPRADCHSTEFDERVVRQLGEFGERRAAAGLRRVTGFDPFSTPPNDDGNRNRLWTIAFAIEALVKFTGDEALDIVEKFIGAGIHPAVEQDRPVGKGLDVIRFYCVQALTNCTSAASRQLLQIATNDPVAEIAEKAAACLRAHDAAS